MGENYAKSMGVEIRIARWVIVLLSSLLAGVTTAIAGPVAFVGLAVPFAGRAILKTSNNHYLFPTTVLLGGAVTGICDLMARTLILPKELPISVMTSLIGAPIVIFLAIRHRNEF